MTNTAYLVYCSTGCSCCNDDNHYRGPFQTQEDAQKAIDHYTSVRLLCSQYSRNGNYSIYTRTCEKLPDSRLIIGTRLVDSFVNPLDTSSASIFED